MSVGMKCCSSWFLEDWDLVWRVFAHEARETRVSLRGINLSKLSSSSESVSVIWVRRRFLAAVALFLSPAAFVARFRRSESSKWIIYCISSPRWSRRWVGINCCRSDRETWSSKILGFQFPPTILVLEVPLWALFVVCIYSSSRAAVLLVVPDVLSSRPEVWAAAARAEGSSELVPLDLLSSNISALP